MTGTGDGADVIVVGAGPSGLLAAGIMARAGIATTVLEETITASTQTRASTLHAGTMEMLERHEVPNLFDLPYTLNGHYIGLPLDLSSAPSPWAGIRRCPQPELVRRLAAWARSHGVRLERDRQVSRLEQTASSVRIRTLSGHQYTARFLVGADGAASTIRQTLGVGLSGPAATRSLVRADTKALGLRPRRFEKIGRLTVTAAALDTTTTRMMMHDPRWMVGQAVGEGEFLTAWAEATGETLPEGLEWIDTFNDGATYAELMVRGNVALCGDAAHQFVPIGGTALNSALLGAEALARRVVRHLHGCPVSLKEHADEAPATAAREARRLRAEARLIFGLGEGIRREREAIAVQLRDDARFRADTVRAVSRLEPQLVATAPLSAGR